MNDVLTAEEFYSWKRNETTKKVLRQLERKADEYLKLLADGNALHQDPMKPGGVPWTVGVIYGIGRIFEIEMEGEDEYRDNDAVTPKL